MDEFQVIGMRFRSSIRNQLIVILILVSMWPTIIVALLGFDEAYKLVKESFNTGQLRSEAFERGNALRLLFELRLQQISILGSYFVVQMMLLNYDDKESAMIGDITLDELKNRLRQDMVGFQQSTGGPDGFYNIKILNKFGDVVFSTNPEEEEINLSEDPTFIKGLKTPFVTIEPNGNFKEMKVVVSVQDNNIQQREKIGVIIATMGTTAVDQILLERSGLAETGETYIVNDQFMLVSESRFIENAPFNVKSDNIVSRECFKNYHHSQEKFVDYRGKSAYVVSYCNKDLGYVLYAQIDEAEVNAPLFKLATLNVQIGLTVIGLSIIIAILFGRTLSRPIIELRKLAAKIAKGDFTAKTSIPSPKNEIGDLVRSFNTMTIDLEKKIELEKELAKTEEKIKKDRITTIGQLASNIAHDLRNPLGAIKNSTQRIKKQNDDKNQIITSEIQRINRSIRRMSHQVEEVLNYVRTTPLIIKNSTTKELLNNSLESLEIPDNVKIVLPKNDVGIACDPEKLVITFINIILNAIQAIDANDGTVTIRVFDENDHVKIEIENTGPSIPADSLPKIFEPLFTSKLKGTGLGLSSCKNIIEQHKGTILVNPDPVLFTIKIPKKQ